MLNLKYKRRYTNHVKNLSAKSGDDSIKSSTSLSAQLFDAIMNQNMDLLYDHLDDPVLRRFLLDFNKNYLLPKVIMSYQREAYRDQSDNVRITFDHSLCGEIFDPDLSYSDQKLLNDHLMILEVKYEHFIPKNIQTIINQIKPNQVAYSKYFYGYQRAFT